MGRLSLWKEGAHTNDYRFFDARIKEQFTIGGTTINIHKYIGPRQLTSSSGDATLPDDIFNALNIQDLLFLENRDRKYDTDVYPLRGIYQLSDFDVDLSQFGLFLQNDTAFITFHLNDMIEQIGRKIIAGDVVELVHMRDYNPINLEQPAFIKKYFVVQDAYKTAEGYSPTWWPHIWRIKAIPMPAGQEYNDILNQDSGNGDGTTIKDLLSTYNNEILINDAVVEQALNEVPEAGYDTNDLYTLPTNPDGSPKADFDPTNPNQAAILSNSPKNTGYSGYMLGDGLAPNGYPVTASTDFPANPEEGQFVLRVDYMPNRLFRYNGRKWVKVEDDVRSPMLPSFNKGQKSSFVNNTNTTTLANGEVVEERQTLSQALKPKADH